MILVTKLDDTPVLVNLEVIKYMEAIPDTLITFINGDSLIVKETIQIIIEKTVEIKAQILRLSQGAKT